MENFRHAFDMESYIYYTQIMQAECLATAYRSVPSSDRNVVGFEADRGVDYGDENGAERGRSTPLEHLCGRWVALESDCKHG